MKKIGLICLALVLALGTLGIGYALWSDNLYIVGVANTGEADWEFYNPQNPGSPPVFTHDDPPGTIDPGWDKDVAWKTWEFVDSDGDGDYDVLLLTIHNAYPGYYNHGSFWVHNNGTIPIHNEDFFLTYDGFVYSLVPAGSWVVTADGAFEILWGDNPGDQLHPSESKNISFSIRVLQPALQNHTYTYTITMTAAQWTESQFP